MSTPGILLLIGLCLAVGLFLAGVRCQGSQGRRALFLGLSGFLVVAVPVAGTGIFLVTCSSPSEMPGLAGAIGHLAIFFGIGVGLIVGLICVAIGSVFDRK